MVLLPGMRAVGSAMLALMLAVLIFLLADVSAKGHHLIKSTVKKGNEDTYQWDPPMSVFGF